YGGGCAIKSSCCLRIFRFVPTFLHQAQFRARGSNSQQPLQTALKVQEFAMDSLSPNAIAAARLRSTLPGQGQYLERELQLGHHPTAKGSRCRPMPKNQGRE